MSVNTAIQNKVNFYEGSYQFKSEVTNLNISEDFIQMVLAKQYEYRPTTETLWAERITTEGTSRFKFDYTTGLEEIILND